MSLDERRGHCLRTMVAMQLYLNLGDMLSGRKHGTARLPIRLTFPINWIPTWGSDVHLKQVGFLAAVP